MNNFQTVLFVNFSNGWGGGELQHLELAVEFDRRGYEVVVLTQPQSELSLKANEKGIKVFSIKVNKLTFLSPIVINKIRKLLSQLNPSAIILNSSIELKHLTFCTSYKKFNLIYRRGYFSSIKPSLLNRFCISRLKYLVVISEYLQKRALDSISKYCQNPPVVIHNGISTLSSFEKPQYLRKRMVAVGRLVESKKFELLIKSMPSILNEVPDAQLWIIGDGPQKEHLEKFINQLHLNDSVFLKGFQKDVTSILSQSSLFVHPAKEEAFGVVFLEAMRQKLPCIAFTGHAADEIIEHGKTGLLVSELTPEALAMSITKLLKSEEELTKMGQAGYERFKSLFTIEKSVEKFIQLIA